MSKHTPGPWVIRHHNGGGNLFRLDNPQTANEFVAQAEPNRKLIEAAPEMFHALRMCRAIFHASLEENNLKRDALERLDAIINQAGGEL